MLQNRKNICEKMPILTHFLTLTISKIEPVPSFIHNEKSLKTTQFQGFYYGRGRRIRSRLPARSVLLLRRGLHRRPAPLDTLRVPLKSNHLHKLKRKRAVKRLFSFLAGAEGFEPSVRGFGVNPRSN